MIGDFRGTIKRLQWLYQYTVKRESHTIYESNTQISVGLLRGIVGLATLQPWGFTPAVFVQFYQGAFSCMLHSTAGGSP